jgi:hypothetical protein
MSTFIKTDPTCSNIYLIDENLCAGNTLNLINYNIASLSAAVLNLRKYEKDWVNVRTLYSTYSATWFRIASNVQSFSAKWMDTYSTVKSLSSTWNTKFTLIYPKIMDVDLWYGEITNLQGSYNNNQRISLIQSWLTQQFPPNKRYVDQLVEVTVFLSKTLTSSFNFNRKYTENCTPTSGSVTLTCNGTVSNTGNIGQCATPPSRSCNHTDSNGSHYCTNPIDQCIPVTSISAPNYDNKSYLCIGSGGRTLSVGYTKQYTEKHTVRTYVILFKNINNTWTFYSQ